ncbi:MAG: hypothetical protein JKY37_21490, partial [Nannocystaceae bacterium]|nr:hypothetical protein [Nannocystaceae bacterium]
MSTHTLHVLVVAVVALCAPSGCAQDLARASSSAIGCPHDAIDISEVSVGWSQMSWTAHCNGMDFYCSGEADATCAPEAFLPPER